MTRKQTCATGELTLYTCLLLTLFVGHRRFNGCILAYGQTGSGKTYSLLNTGSGAEAKHSGLVPRIVAQLFVLVTSDASHVYNIEASMVQIYNEQARLSLQNLLLTCPTRSTSPTVGALACSG